MEDARVDAWLWAIRLFKTRSLATDACKGGHVRVNGHPAKPATRVKPGDRVEARAGGRARIIEVLQPIDKRVGAAIAAECFADHSPPPPPPEFAAPPAVRDRGTGRPTKKERRQLDRFRGSG
jgi:ribosome-associated heat shock protein Hsp15